MPSDGQRVKPVDILVIHHAVSDEMNNWSDVDVSNWFNNTGRNRGYAGIEHSGHYDPYNGKETFAQAHFCLHKYSADGNKYGWRLTLLMKDPFENVAWHAGNWPINQRSIGIETAGLYTNHELDEKALMLVADTFREYDRQLGGSGLNIFGHRDFSPTQCPGNMLYPQLPNLIDMVNNPDKWNAKLFPAPTPDPEPEKLEKFPIEPTTFAMREAINLYKIETQQIMGQTGGNITVVGRTNIYKGSTYYLAEYSMNLVNPNGFREEDLYGHGDIVHEPPIDPPVEPPVDPPTEDEVTKYNKALYDFNKQYFGG